MDRNTTVSCVALSSHVALRKESVDRNVSAVVVIFLYARVALRKESVDRNEDDGTSMHGAIMSLSARRAWIEMGYSSTGYNGEFVALRKESVDRNNLIFPKSECTIVSLSARRAWIEIM